jgi:hypothetical protein
VTVPVRGVVGVAPARRRRRRGRRRHAWNLSAWGACTFVGLMERKVVARTPSQEERSEVQRLIDGCGVRLDLCFGVMMVVVMVAGSRR